MLPSRRPRGRRKLDLAIACGSIPDFQRCDLLQKYGTGNVLFSPFSHGAQYRSEGCATAGKEIFRARRIVLIELFFDESRRFKALQAFGQNVGGYRFCRSLKFAVAVLAQKQVAHHDQRPFVTHDV